MKKTTEIHASIECQRGGRGCFEDPLDDPSFDLMAWIMTIDFRPKQRVPSRDHFIASARAAGFQDVELRALGDRPLWEFRCAQGTNRECTTAEQLENCLAFIACECGWHILPGQFLGMVDDGSIAAWFRMESGEQVG